MNDPNEPLFLELEVGSMAAGGGCVARDPDGRVVFVRHALPGERVRARVSATTSKFRRADAIEVLEASVERVTPPCPHAGPGRCGGCDFQHIALPAQRALKAGMVAEQLRRVAGVELDVVVEAVPGDADGLGWRTRVRMAIDADGHPGFYRHRSHDIVAVGQCPITHPAALATGALEATWEGAEQIEVATDGGRSVVSVHARRSATPVLPTDEQVRAGLVVNGKVARQPPSTVMQVDGLPYRVTAGVFWQVHAGAAAVLGDAVLEALDPHEGESAVDLYAGAGLFAVLLGQRVGERGAVLAIERDAKACRDARHNARHLPQVRVHEGSVTPRLVADRIGKPDSLVLDPAREGAGTEVMGSLAARPGRLRAVAYVSCDAASFSRDVRVLLDAGWSMPLLRAFDLFPMTEHVELVATLTPPG
ncbi:MAG TPA: TRAM domain-containing protein [Acidimicrobiales bacterium]